MKAIDIYTKYKYRYLIFDNCIKVPNINTYITTIQQYSYGK